MQNFVSSWLTPSAAPAMYSQFYKYASLLIKSQRVSHIDRISGSTPSVKYIYSSSLSYLLKTFDNHEITEHDNSDFMF